MEGLLHTINRLENASRRVRNFIDANLEEWCEDVLREARRAAAEVGLSQWAQDAMSLEKTGYMKVDLVWEYYGPDDQPLHEFLENGFKRHIIRPKGKENGGADVLMWKDKNGKPVFRKKVRHPGFKGYHIMRDTWKAQKPFLKQRIVEEVSHYMKTERLQ